MAQFRRIIAICIIVILTLFMIIVFGAPYLLIQLFRGNK